MDVPEPLAIEALFRRCPDDAFTVASTAEIEPADGIVGQDRAVSAIAFAVAVEGDGHNIFVMGPAGTGRRTLIHRALRAAAAARPAPCDWCYVNNFEDAHTPVAIDLPAGLAKRFAARMEQFIVDVRTSLAAAFEGEDYRSRRQAIEAEFEEQQANALKTVHEEAKRRGIRVMQSPSGLIFAPIKNGETLGPEDFEKLPEDEQATIRQAVEEIGKALQAAMRDMPLRIRRTREQVAELDNQVTRFAVGSLIDDLVDTYAQYPKLKTFLEAVQDDLVRNSAQLRGDDESKPPWMRAAPEESAVRRYAVNVVVSHAADDAAPVVVAERPTYTHLVGRVEHRAQLGTLTTDFTLIRGGALHHANGGYLVIDARRLLSEPYAWVALKQALQSRCIKIESLAEAYALTTTVALEPEPIPLAVKVALIGDRQIYYLLRNADPEFADLFKVAADFDDRMARTTSSQQEFATIMAALAKRHGLRPISRPAMCRVVEESSRDAGDGDKLSTEVRRVEDLLREADYWARTHDHDEIAGTDIDAAIDSREYRHGRIRERVLEEIERGTILIDTTGEKVGQINGLAVFQLGDTAFGRPNRITARVGLGSGKVIDIEREVDLGGSLHSKGILILSGYIAATYGRSRPLSLSATLTFEQSYGGVDGDSASCAELYALLSAIAGVPIRQSFAVTGSVNQYGEVQAIGGVNEKIEGFFDVCAARGLSGEQGVLIPRSNVKHLMLRSRVVDACAAGTFRIVAVEHVDEGLALLTGLPTAAPAPDGTYPRESLNHRIDQALQALAQRRAEFGKRGGDGNSNGAGER